ncbi:hypothetical protein AB6H35_01230 [Citrobacter freundii]|uniref:hypothetical protein n=1 Tax=Citrobacter freundii TaxID=546 RepID=UPI0034DD66B2
MSLLVDLHTSGKRLNAGATINNAGIGVLPIWRENGFYLQIFSKLSMSYTGGRVVLLVVGRQTQKTRRGGRAILLMLLFYLWLLPWLKYHLSMISISSHLYEDC